MPGEMDLAHRPATENLLQRIRHRLTPRPHVLTTDLKDIQQQMTTTIENHLTREPRVLLLVATQREGTTTLGPTSRDWITVGAITRDPGVLHGIRLTGWLATNTARQHRDYHLAATHLTERTTP